MLKNIIQYIQNIFNKKKVIKELYESTEKSEESNNSDFINSLKEKVSKRKKKCNIESLICAGDGTGIKEKIKG